MPSLAVELPVTVRLVPLLFRETVVSDTPVPPAALVAPLSTRSPDEFVIVFESPNRRPVVAPEEPATVTMPEVVSPMPSLKVTPAAVGDTPLRVIAAPLWAMRDVSEASWAPVALLDTPLSVSVPELAMRVVAELKRRPAAVLAAPLKLMSPLVVSTPPTEIPDCVQKLVPLRAKEPVPVFAKEPPLRFSPMPLRLMPLRASAPELLNEPPVMASPVPPDMPVSVILPASAIVCPLRLRPVLLVEPPQIQPEPEPTESVEPMAATPIFAPLFGPTMERVPLVTDRLAALMATRAPTAAPLRP